MFKNFLHCLISKAPLPPPRSFYPIFPAPSGACLDTSHYSALQLAACPDLLVLPSNLAPFAKLLPLDGPAAAPGGHVAVPEGSVPFVVAVNPGRLAKGTSGGSFAHVSLAAPAEPSPEPVHRRMRVDIRRL